GRSCRQLARPAPRAMFTMRDQLLLPLDLLVQTHGHILDDRVRNLQAPLEFLDQAALRAMQCEVNIESFSLFGHAISHLPRSPLLHLLHFAAMLGSSLLERAHDLRSEEHTSELQSRGHLVCRLLLEKKK